MRQALALCLMLGPAAFAAAAFAADDGHHHHDHNMSMDATGMVMNDNRTRLPRDCAEISQDVSLTVYAGVEFAADYPGTVFGLSEHIYRAPPCSRITVRFVNKDQIRHQWMIHGLPRYLYDAGMFHLEAAGGHEQTGTFIVPSDHRTYLVHCDMAQHMEKGMKAQLKVGMGDGDLWAIPGVSGDFVRDSYRSTD
ncbi:MAG: copper oxidase [Proteobacteria bacterium]|nr:copper oxidase [Pseudomonadota bacterium]